MAHLCKRSNVILSFSTLRSYFCHILPPIMPNIPTMVVIAHCKTSSIPLSPANAKLGLIKRDSHHWQNRLIYIKILKGSAQRFALPACGRVWTMLGSRKNSKPEKCLKMPQNPTRQVHALLGGFDLPAIWFYRNYNIHSRFIDLTFSPLFPTMLQPATLGLWQ